MKVWMGAHSCGEHAGAVCFTGELAVGDFRSCRAVVSSVPCFLSLTRGSHLPVAAAERKPVLGCAVLGCVRAQSWAA